MLQDPSPATTTPSPIMSLTPSANVSDGSSFVDVNTADTPTATSPSPTTFVSISGNDYAKRFRRINDELASCGIGEYIDAPAIAIIGSQSAGKSSVLEALSGISFPRAAGTCTRTPTFVRLYNAPNKQWSCTVTLRLEFDNRNQPLKSVETLSFGAALTNAKDVQDYISAAQYAILNPKKTEKLTADRSAALASELVKVIRARHDTSDNEIDFSQNTICLEVRGPDVADLSLIDLPGLIGTAGQGKDQRLVTMIRDLARKTIKQDNCLILLTIPMSEDYNNQSAVNLAREVDPDGLRTLGVLTKPDRIEGGNFKLWKPIVEGMTERLLHGYHVVRNPSSSEMATAVNAREIEAAFFAKQPWCDLTADACERLGSTNLGARLQQLLGKLIEDKLPGTIEKVHVLSHQTDAKMHMLPVAIAEDRAKVELHNLCLTLCETLKNVLRGDTDASKFALPQKILFRKFRSKIFASRPLIYPFTAAEMVPNATLAATIKDKKDLCKHDDLESAESVVDLSEATMKEVNDVLKLSSLRARRQSPLQINLTTIQEAIGGCATELLPGNVPWSVKEILMRQSVEPMFALAIDLFNDILHNLTDVIKFFAHARFSAFPSSQVGVLVTDVLLQNVNKCAAGCIQLLEGIVKTEKDMIASLNHHYYTDKRAAIVKELSDVRTLWQLDDPAAAKLPPQISFGQSFGEAQQVFIAPSVPASRPYKMPAPVLEQIEVCAEVRAYWQVVYKRFVDYVRGFIVVHLVQAFSTTCLQELCDGIGLHGDLTQSRAMELLRESDATHAQRKRLTLQKSRLDKALEVIAAIQRGSL